MLNPGRKIIILLPLILLSLRAVKAEEYREEAIFSLKYGKFTNDYIVYVKNDSVFIPFEDVISFLKIYYQADNSRNISGYVNNADSSFTLNFGNKEYTDISGEKHKLSDSQWFAEELQTFVRTDLFAAIFKLDVKTYFNQLAIKIISPYELPLERSMRIAYVSNNFKREETGEEYGPLISKNKFTVLNGGILDYSLGANKTGSRESYNFGGSLGLEILDGEFMYNINGSLYQNNMNYNERIRWRYLINSDFLSSVSLGDLFNVNYRNNGRGGYRKPFRNIRGIQFTNETAKMPNVFSNYLIEDVIEPGWNVELYLDDQLYDVQKADMTGYFRFEIPISYGITNMTVKYYGPNGEFISEDKVLNIPSDLLPPGEMRYVLDAGQDISTKDKLIDGTFSMGLTDWLTGTVSATKEESTSDYTLVSQSAINLFNYMMLNLTASNTGIYEAGIRIPNSSFGSYDLVYTSYDNTLNSAFSGKLNSIFLMSSFSGRLLVPVSFSLYGSRDAYVTRNVNNLNSNIRFYFSGINISLRHNLYFNDYMGKISDLRQSVNADLSYYLSKLPGFLSFFNNTRLSTSTYFDPETMNFNDARFALEQRITKDIALNLNYTYDFQNNSTGFRTSLNMNLPYIRNRSNADYRQGNEMSYSTSLNGSVEFDSYNMNFNMLNSLGSNNNFGKSSAAVRFYIDHNYNNQFDEGDELIPEADFYTTSGFVKKDKSDGYYILSNLMPGNRYNIKIKQETFPNPSLIPEYTEFSFIAEPYSYKAINIACQPGGMAEGKIIRVLENGKTKEQGGLKVHFESEDKEFSKEVNVFSDGSFYFMGLPIGKYNVYVDSVQLEILKSKSVPPGISINIKPLQDGDYKSNLNFKLIPYTGPKKDSVIDVEKEDMLVKTKPQNKTINDSTILISDIGQALNSPAQLDSLAALLIDKPVNKLVCVIRINKYDDHNMSGNGALTKLLSYFMEKEIPDDRIDIRYDIDEKYKPGSFTVELNVVKAVEDQLKKSGLTNKETLVPR